MGKRKRIKADEMKQERKKIAFAKLTALSEGAQLASKAEGE